MNRQDRPIILGLFGTLTFFAVWEAVNRLQLVNVIMLPAPSTILFSTWLLIKSGELQHHLIASLGRAALGFVSGAGLGVTLGVAMGRMPRVNNALYPLLQMFRAIPALAFVPIAVFWFGIGETSKVFLIAWGVFFPTWVNTFIGVRDVNMLLLRAGASLGAQGWRMLVFVVLPASLPYIIAGLRISIGIALMLLVAAELTGAVFGVGYLIQMSQLVFRVDQMFVGLLVLGLMGYLADFLFNRMVEWLLPWYGAERKKLPSRG